MVLSSFYKIKKLLGAIYYYICSCLSQILNASVSPAHAHGKASGIFCDLDVSRGVPYVGGQCGVGFQLAKDVRQTGWIRLARGIGTFSASYFEHVGELCVHHHLDSVVKLVGKKRDAHSCAPELLQGFRNARIGAG